MAGYLIAEPEPPILPAAWQPYADRTALVYGTVNTETRHMEISEVYVQDGPCDVTPSLTQISSTGCRYCRSRVRPL